MASIESPIIEIPSHEFRVEFTPVSDLAAIEAAWANLFENLQIENPFYAPWALIPALKNFASPDVQIATVWRGDELWGLAPMERADWYANLPVAHYRVWRYPHCYLTMPLMRCGSEFSIIKSLTNLVQREGGVFLQAPLVNVDMTAMRVSLNNHFCYRPRRYQRAALIPGAAREQYLATAIRGKKRKEYRRQRRRLGDIGVVAFNVFGKQDNVVEWASEFLALEEKSWKGDAGTAMSVCANDASWFRAALAGAAGDGALDLFE